MNIKKDMDLDGMVCPQEGCGGHIVWVKGVPICTNSAQAKALLSGGKMSMAKGTEKATEFKVGDSFLIQGALFCGSKLGNS